MFSDTSPVPSLLRAGIFAPIWAIRWPRQLRNTAARSLLERDTSPLVKGSTNKSVCRRTAGSPAACSHPNTPSPSTSANWLPPCRCDHVNRQLERPWHSPLIGTTAGCSKALLLGRLIRCWASAPPMPTGGLFTTSPKPRCSHRVNRSRAGRSVRTPESVDPSLLPPERDDCMGEQTP